MGLQNDVKAALNIDPAFVVSPEDRPRIGHNLSDPSANEQVPVIDLNNIDTATSEIQRACKDWGFFQVINHGVPLHLIHTLQSQAAEFFSLPVQDKSKVRRDFRIAASRDTLLHPEKLQKFVF